MRFLRHLIGWIAVVWLAAPSLSPAPRAQSQEAGSATLPRVFLYATGGTISNRSGGRLTVDELIKTLPNLDQRVRAEGEQFSNVASTALTLDQWLELSRRINDRFKKDAGLSGVIVTTGTDTLEELSYFLHLTVRDERRVAADPAARGLGTLVVLNDEINSARDVTKTDSHRLDTFDSRSYGVLGRVIDRVLIVRKPVRRHTAQSEFDVASIKALPRVDVILTYQGAPADLIKASVDAGAKGIIMAGAGAAALSGNQREGTDYAVEKGVFIVSTTRTGSGNIAIGRGNATSRRISGDDLQPVKARILLMLALTRTEQPEEIQRIFREY
jgi:L-asparaginase